MTDWVIIFIIAVFALMVGFMEVEKNDWDSYFEEQMRVQDSLWIKWQEKK